MKFMPGLPRKSATKQVGRTVVHLLRLADLLDLSSLHHNHAGSKGHRLELVVGDIDGGRAKRLMQLLDLGAHRGPQLGIEIGEAFVEQKHLGIAQPAPARWRRAAAVTRELTRTAGPTGGRLCSIRAFSSTSGRISDSGLPRILRPNSMFWGTLMVG